MSLLNKYGFDFDGSTTIKAYKNELLNTKNFSVYFDIKIKSNSNIQLIFSGDSFSIGGYVDIRVENGTLKNYYYDSILNETLTSNLLTINTQYKCCLRFSDNGGQQQQELYINGNLINSDSSIIADSTLNIANLSESYHFGNIIGGSSYSNSILADFTFYNETLTAQECIDVTRGQFNKDDSRIVFLETFNQETKGTIAGTEQYAKIESATESGCYLKLNYPAVDPNWRQTNSNGTPKAPANWILEDDSEIERFKPSVTIAPEWYTEIFYGEYLSVLFNTQTADNLYTGTCTFTAYIVSGNATSSFRVYYNDTQKVDFSNVTTNHIVSITFDLKSNMEFLRFTPLVDGEELDIYTDLTFNVQSLPMPITTEFANFQIDTKQVSNVTIANTLSTRKTGKTEKNFTSDLIITPEQNSSMLEVLSIARSNKKLTDFFINAVEMAGNTIATNPQESGFEQYYFNGVKSSQKTGLYNYITVSYLNNPNNGVY